MYITGLDYEQAVEMIDTIPRPNDLSTVSRFTRLSEFFGMPHKKFRSILLGGTNGKGSTCHMVAGILRMAGLTVGLATKPHLYRFNERCQVNGEAISDKDLVRLVRVVTSAEGQLKERFGELTKPERRYLVWFLYLAERQPDVVVCEVNEGGRYDITNVLNPELVVITNVGLDHQDTLGSTIGQIAWHKAGTIKSDQPVVTAAEGESLHIIENQAKVCRAPLWRLGREIRIRAASAGHSGTLVTVSIDDVVYKDVHTQMLGSFQTRNVALAVGVGHILSKLGWGIGEESIRAGIADAIVPGRLEIISHDPTIIIDGAHNSDKAAALAGSLADLFPNRPVVMVVSTTQTRIDAIVPILAKSAKVFIACRSQFPRAANPEAIAKAAQAYTSQVFIEDSVADAVELAVKFATQLGGISVVTGALITIGEVPRGVTNGRGD